MTTLKTDEPAEEAFGKLKSLVFPAFELRQKQWEEGLWTSGCALVEALAECLSLGLLGEPGELRSWLLWHAGEDYTQNPTAEPEPTRKIDTPGPGRLPERSLGEALALVYCAELALRHREDEQEMGALLLSLRNGRDRGFQPTPEWFAGHFPGRDPVTLDWLEANRPQSIRTLRQMLADEDWVWGCIRTLQGAPVLGGGMRQALCAPVVGVDLKGQALVHTLVVEVLNQGTGRVFRHPCDALDTEPVLDTQFDHSMRTAFRTALVEVSKGKPEAERMLVDGRWRLLHGWKWDEQKRRELRPLVAPSGASASGAAARLWWFALSGKVPDDRVVVIAQVNEAGQIVAVESEPVGPKLEAVIQMVSADSQQGWQYFDTVCVVEDNVNPAREAVEAAVKQRRIREDQLEVVDIAHHENRRSNTPATTGV